MIDERTSLLKSSENSDVLDASVAPTSNSLPVITPSEQDQSKISQDEDGHDAVSGGKIYVIMPSLLLGIFLANADTSLITATGHEIASQFNLLSQASWLVTSYSLAMCSTLGMYGKFSDIFGRKSMLLLAYILFMVGCVLCGSATQYWVLLAGRVFSGCGGAGMTTLVAIITTDLVPLRSIAIWRSYANVIGTLGRITGAPLGGLIFDTLGWRWSFYIQVPVAGAILLLSVILLPNNLGIDDDDSKATTKSRLSRVDIFGAASLTLSVCAISLFLDTLGKGEKISSPLAWVSLLLAILASTLFVYTERHLAREPILPIDLITCWDLSLPCLASFCHHAGQFSIMFTLPMYFEITRGAPASAVGVYLLPSFVGYIIGSLFSSIYIAKVGTYKKITIFAQLISWIGFTLLIVRFCGHPSIYEVAYIGPGGMAIGFVISTMYTHIAASMSKRNLAIASSCFYLASNLGLILGLNLSNAILHFVFFRTTDDLLDGITNRKEIVQKAFSSIGYVRNLPSHLRELVIEAYLRSFTSVFGFCLLCIVLGTFSVLTVRERRI